MRLYPRMMTEERRRSSSSVRRPQEKVRRRASSSIRRSRERGEEIITLSARILPKREEDEDQVQLEGEESRRVEGRGASVHHRFDPWEHAE